MENTKIFSHIVFDVDGTLLDTEQMVLQSFQKTLKEEAGMERTVSELSFCLGITGEEALRRLDVESVVGEGQTARILKKWIINTGEMSDLVRVFDGICTLLEGLVRQGISLGIVTSRTKEECEKDGHMMALLHYFGTVICSEDSKKHKPDPDPMLAYLKLSGAKPEEVLYIGDSIYDMECGKAAGVNCALALWGCNSARHIRADYYFPKPYDVLSLLDRIAQPFGNRIWISWAMEMQFIAQAGLTYSKDVFDLERFARLRELSAEIMENYTNLSEERVTDLFCGETGYQTPKLDTRAAIIEDGRILLVKERDGLWSVPGGWVDVNQTVGRNMVKEVEEEAGLTVVPYRVVALQDKNLHNPPAFAYGICKVFFLCRIVEGEFKANIETVESSWFERDHLPELSEDKITKAQIDMCFDAYEDQNWQPVFD